MSMFGAPDPNVSALPRLEPALPDVEEFLPAELLKFEKELLGFYITSHPLTEHQAAIDRYTTASTKEAMNCAEGIEVTIGCMLAAVRPKIAKSGRSAGQKWAILAMEDLDGTIEGMCFAEAYAAITQKYPDAIQAERIVFVKGKVDKKRETPSIMVNEVIPIEAALERMTTALILKFDRARHTGEHVEAAKAILKASKGNLPVFVQSSFSADGKDYVATLRLANDFAVKPSQALVDDLRTKLGNEAVDMAGPGTKRKKRLEQQRLFKEEQADLPEATAVQSSTELPRSEEEAMAAMDMEMEAAEA
jgi:DNA polymerase-3 subunit alpha